MYKIILLRGRLLKKIKKVKQKFVNNIVPYDTNRSCLILTY